ncbi:MAG: M42 family metallopeptidase [Luteibaculaceae bacterium]
MLNLALLEKVCQEPGAPGFEERIRNLVIKEVTPYVDKVSTDNLGNVIAFKKGKTNKRMMIAAHMDEISFIVTHIDDNGFLRFAPLGGFDPKTLTAQRVLVHGKEDVLGVMGAKPIHVMSPEERTKAPKLTDFFIDLGLPKEKVVELISVGDPVTRYSTFHIMGENINAKSLDNRISVFILVEALKLLKEPSFDTYAVFTVQEEVGIRGANVAALEINPDFGIAIDTTIAFDVPGASPHEKITELGKGVAIKIMDSSTICDYRMVRFMKQVAQENEIEWQPEVLTGGGTDTAGIQRMNAGGSIAGAISVPTRNIHQVIEMVNKKDVENAIKLLNHCLEKAGDYNWKHN